MANKLGKVVADFQTSLATKISAGETNVTIQSSVDDDGEYLVNGQYYFTIDGDNSSKEHILGTLSTATNAISYIQSYSRQGGYSDSVTGGVARDHRVGATISITDHGHIKVMSDILSGAVDLESGSPLVYSTSPTFVEDEELVDKGYIDDNFVAIAGDQSVANIKNFYGAFPTGPEAQPTVDIELANKAYVDATAIFGAPLADSVTAGIIEEATTAEVLAGDYEGATGARLYINPQNLIDAGFSTQNYATADHVIPLPVDIPNYATSTFTGGTGTPDNTVAYVGLVDIPYAVTVDKIILHATAVTVNGSVQVALYSEDGQTQYFSEYVGELTGAIAGTATAYDMGSVSLNPGYYYLAFKNETDTTVNAWTSASNLFSGYVDAVDGTTVVLSGETTVGAGALPATIEPRSITPGNSRILAIKLE